MSTRSDEIAERLGALGDEIGDLAYDTIREAIARGDTEVPAIEKRLNRARRAVEKAAALLRDENATDIGD